ncbi:MAG TPA: ABC transporter ATP-binding protein, partial [Terriglobia bacterium]|nr:ABC transporter ATP-binding protein [Terriglobia bacterium]
ILEEPFIIHGVASRRQRVEEVKGLLKVVGLDLPSLDKYPHQFSGGQRQRIAVARALALKPQLIVADEPVSALDVSVQAQIISLFEELQAQYNLTYLFISHGIPVVEYISHTIGVMYLGKLVEVGNCSEIAENPLHPYTQILLASVPVLNRTEPRGTTYLEGEVPSPINPPSGCRFHSRCPFVMERCKSEVPKEIHVTRTHWVSCHLIDEKG